MSDVDLSLRQLLSAAQTSSATPSRSRPSVPLTRERGMVGQGGRSFDIIRQLVGNVVNIFNKRPTVCTAPCDGMVLRMHYQWTFWALLGSFSAIWFSWFHRDVITCASHYNAETQVRLDYINICLSYPYLQGSNGERRYILYYRWIHWVLLLLAGLYYIPHKISKTSDNAKVKKLFEDLAVAAHRYDHFEKEQVDRTARYIIFNLKTHNGLFFKYLICNILSLLVDIFCIHFFDFVFQGRFLKYGLMVYPFNRDVEEFSDYMSQTFPPFVICELGVTYQLTNKRKEILGCHLTVMELYEKIFFVIWIWLIALTVITALYIIYLFFLWIPFVRLHVLRIAKPFSAKHQHGKMRQTVCDSITECKIGDVYLLYRLRQHFSHARYYELLTRLADPAFTKLESISIDHHNMKANQDLRQRNKGQIKSPTKFPEAFFGKPEGRYLPNSSILVE